MSGHNPPPLAETLTVTLPALLAGLERRVQGNERRMATLKKSGLIYAAEHFRKNTHGEPSFLYLIYPTQAGEKRRRDYVGSDPDKIAKARAGIERANEYDRIEQGTRQIIQQLQKINIMVDEALALARRTAEAQE
jgi:hypothetical protein